MAGKAISAVKNTFSKLAKLKFVSPFKITGVASGAEFKHYLPTATEYRHVAPGSQAVRAIVPQAETDRVFDIKYFPRDSRREGMLVGGTNVTELIREVRDPTTITVQQPEGLPPRPGSRHRWSKPMPYLTEENGGYT